MSAFGGAYGSPVGFSPDIVKADLGALYTALSQAPAGTTGRLVNKSTGESIYLARSRGGGVVRAMVDPDDSWITDNLDGEAPVVHLDRVTPHQVGYIASGSAAVWTLDAGHNLSGTFDAWIWRPSTGAVVTASVSAEITDTDEITFGSSQSLVDGDLVFAIGVSEIDVDCWLPGESDGSADQTAAIESLGWTVANSKCARIRYLESGRSDHWLSYPIQAVIADDGAEPTPSMQISLQSNSWLLIGWGSEADAQFIAGGTFNTVGRGYTRSAGYDETTPAPDGAAATATTLTAGVGDRLYCQTLPREPDGDDLVGSGWYYDASAGSPGVVGYYAGKSYTGRLPTTWDAVALAAYGTSTKPSITISKLILGDA